MLFRNTIKKIRKSFGRYFSILAIVFIGAGVFAGLASSAPDMVKSSGNYYDNAKLMDFKVLSTMGITDDDVTALRQVEGVESAVGTYSLDVLDRGNAIRVHALEEGVNGYLLKSGREPERATECLADVAFYQVGDTIKITSDTGTKLKDKTFTVVGTVQTPLYISAESYGNTTIGDGKIHSFIFIPRSDFNMDVYTEAYIRADGTCSAAAYTAEYDKAEKDMNGKLVAFAPTREKARYDEVYSKAASEIADNQKKLDDEKRKGEEELADAKAKLDSGSAQLAQGREELESSQVKLTSTMKEKEATFASGRAQIADGWKQIDAGCAKAGVTRSNVCQKETEIAGALATMEDQLPGIPPEAPQYTQLKEQIDQLKVAQEGLKQLDGSITQLADKQKELDEGERAYRAGIDDAKARIRDGKRELASNERELSKGYADWREGAKKLADNTTDAQEKLDDASAKLADIKHPTWHIYSRDDITGYEAFKSATEVITAVTMVFPIFFVLIVMLMTSNAMARMIVEERGELGALSSLGYSNKAIISTYLFYVLSASIAGGLLGYFVGCSVIPTVIGGAFQKFIHPPLTLYFDPWMLALILAVIIVVMAAVTTIACYAELRQEPSALLRPAPPKGGHKGILLERIRPIWNRLSFTWKVTLRNLFRYKKRGLMIIVGVAGCTALLLTGFGLRDSIGGVAEKQFSQIIRYDDMIILKDSTNEMDANLKKTLDEQSLVDPLLIKQETFTSMAGNRNLDSYLVVPQDNKVFRKQFGLFDASTGKPLELSDSGVIVTSKFAQLSGVKVGDSVSIKDADEKEYELPIAGIAENYMMHYIYASPAVYTRYLGEPATYNAVVVKKAEGAPSDKELAQALVKQDEVQTVVNNQDALVAATNTNKSIDTIVILVVVIAALLAVVVLYNLTSINISERTREVATLKVLGFTDRETDSYIYREAFILTILSIFVGYGLGLALHGFAVTMIENQGMGLFRHVLPLSYVYSAIIVIILAFVMQGVSHYKLTRIDMIDSLKSVE